MMESLRRQWSPDSQWRHGKRRLFLVESEKREKHDMTTRLKSLFAVTFAALVLYLLYFWPIPGFMADGIPYTSYVAKELGPRYLVQGDHLQLLYHFELLNGFFHGDTPWFRNLWEFNMGDAQIPRMVEPYYAPFALPYVLLRTLGCNDALSWNLTQALSVWLGVFFCYCLARRYGVKPLTALAISVVANAVPYRWVTLSGGSPTGFGMGLLPGVVLGVDLAVRDKRVWGGVFGGVCLLACYAIDLHCFLFAALSLPLWGLVALLRTKSAPDGNGAKGWDWRAVGRLAVSVLPLAVAGVLSLAIAAAIKSGYQSTDVSGGRTWNEIRLCSPDWRSFFDPFFECHMSDQYHMGWMLPVLLAACGVVLLAGAWMGWRFRRGGSTVREALFRGYVFGTVGVWCAGALLAAGILFSFLLALGVNGPVDGLPLRFVRALVPPFRMVRQPIKVFCLLPALYTSFFAFSVVLAALIRQRTGLRALRGESALRRFAAVLIPAAVVLSLSGRMFAGVCLLPGKNAAYEAGAALAREQEPVGRALVLPVWPGDSSYSSLYQYHAQRSGLRMLNGYAAVKTSHYLERVFYAFETMTEGDCTQAQVDALRELGVRVVLLQENAWPSKVSSFPFGYTLRRFLANPQFAFLAEEDGVWAFRLKEPEEVENAPCTQISPPVGIVRHFTGPFGKDRLRFRLRAFAEYQQNGSFGWLIRGRLPESLTAYCDTVAGDETDRVVRMVEPGPPDAVRLATIARPPAPPQSFSWLEFPFEEGQNPGLELLDVAYAPLQPLAKEQDGTLRLCVADLAHEFGTTVLDGNGEPDGLAFRPLRDPVSCAVAGPDRPLPFPAGRYRAELVPDDPHLELRLPGAVNRARNAIEFDYDGTSFVNFTIQYDGREPAQARAILVRPVPGTERSVP